MNFQQIQRFYNNGSWGKGQVALAVRKGIITKDEFREITGEAYTDVPSGTPPTTLAEVHAATQAAIVAGSNQYAALVKARYSQFEVDSFARQQAEAETVLAGGELPPDALLPVLVEANQTTLEEFARRVMNNVAQADALGKIVLAQQQAYEKQVKDIMNDTATSDEAKIAALTAIVVHYVIPGQEE